MRALWLAATLHLLAGVAHAHAPLARQLVLGSAVDDGAVSVLLPGFGLALRPTGNAPFAFACDALIGVAPQSAPPVILRRPDGRLLVGTGSGLGLHAANGCPVVDAEHEGNGLPAGVPIAALASDGGAPARVYAITDEPNPALYRSEDAGMGWEHVAWLGEGPVVSGLLITGDTPARVYVSRAEMDGSQLAWSSDGGETFETMSVPGALTLRAHVGDIPDRLWATVAHPVSRDVSLVRVTMPATTGAAVAFEETHRVRFFGGFARDERDGTLWLADEAGGLFRSDDAGDTFDAVRTDLAVACLHATPGQLWACVPGTTDQPAVMVSGDGGQHFDPVLSLGEVKEQVACAPETDAAALCALAWNEWQADVLRLAPAPAATDPAATDPVADPTTPAPEPDPQTRADTNANPDGGNDGAADGGAEAITPPDEHEDEHEDEHASEDAARPSPSSDMPATDAHAPCAVRAPGARPTPGPAHGPSLPATGFIAALWLIHQRRR